MTPTLPKTNGGLPLELTSLIAAFPGLRVVVVGDGILDRFRRGHADRLCREGPFPVVAVAEREDVPGGAANVAVNVAALGAQTEFVSVVGADHEGDLLRRALSVRGVGTSGVVVDRSRSTVSKVRVSGDGQLLLRFDEGDTSPVGPEVAARLVAELRRLTLHADAVIVSDYEQGVFTAPVVEALGRLDVPFLAIDAKHAGRWRAVRPTVVKPNFDEALELTGPGADGGSDERPRLISAQAERLLEATGARIVAVTLDREGSMVVEQGRHPYRTHARAVSMSAAVGAGDTYLAAFSLALAAGAESPAAAELASRAADVVVGQDGTSSCSRGELLERITSPDKVEDLAGIRARVARYRAEGRRIVFTNGCFDLIHRGHITYLGHSKTLGDVLIVGLNSDQSVRRLKGPGRPLNRLADRAEVLASLSCVEHVVAFEGDSPTELIRAIRPDVYVKGGDYAREAIPEAALVEALGGEVRLAPYVEDHSTTDLIARVRHAAPVATGRARRV